MSYYLDTKVCAHVYSYTCPYICLCTRLSKCADARPVYCSSGLLSKRRNCRSRYKQVRMYGYTDAYMHQYTLAPARLHAWGHVDHASMHVEAHTQDETGRNGTERATCLLVRPPARPSARLHAHPPFVIFPVGPSQPNTRKGF